MKNRVKYNNATLILIRSIISKFISSNTWIIYINLDLEYQSCMSYNVSSQCGECMGPTGSWLLAAAVLIMLGSFRTSLQKYLDASDD